MVIFEHRFSLVVGIKRLTGGLMCFWLQTNGTVSAHCSPNDAAGHWDWVGWAGANPRKHNVMVSLRMMMMMMMMVMVMVIMMMMMMMMMMMTMINSKLYI